MTDLNDLFIDSVIPSEVAEDVFITNPREITKVLPDYEFTGTDLDTHFDLLDVKDIKRHIRYNKSVIIDTIVSWIETIPNANFVLCHDITIDIDKCIHKNEDGTYCEVSNLGSKYTEDYLNHLRALFNKFESSVTEDERFALTHYHGDIYFPEHKVLICINSYKDSIEHYLDSTSKNFVFDRTENLSNENGIRTINIFEDHFLDKHKMTVLKDIITHANRLTNKKIYARDTVVKIMPALQMKPFFLANNIQQYRNAKTAFVLVAKKDLPKVGIKKDQPVMCYTVGFAHFGKGAYDAEIARGACLLGHSVVGGASKLWKSILEYYEDKNLDNTPGRINSIVYYSDNNYYDGKSVNLLEGTELICTTPGFWNYWCGEFKMKNREPMKHKEITAKTYALRNKIQESGSNYNLYEVLYSDMAFEVRCAGTHCFVLRRKQEDQPSTEESVPSE